MSEADKRLSSNATTQIIDNMSRGWNGDSAGVALGAEREGMSAAIWSHDVDDVQEGARKVPAGAAVATDLTPDGVPRYYEILPDDQYKLKRVNVAYYLELMRSSDGFAISPGGIHTSQRRLVSCARCDE